MASAGGLDTRAVLAQIDALLSEFNRAKTAARFDDLSGGLPEHELQAIATRMMAAIRRLSPPGSDYIQRAESLGRATHAHTVMQFTGILMALRTDVEAGYLQTLTELVHADLFADFLEMADELQDKGFKDAAAVIAGSVLEEHLRKLADKFGIDAERPDGLPKKADTLNAELAGGGVFNKLVQKSVTAWLGLRNSAAHGKYDEYDHAQVAALIRDVRDFMIRHPA